jgi:cytochrome c oxidase cbb3-type subunit 4
MVAPVIDFSFDSLAYFAKSWGLFYLIGLSVCVLVYAYRPSKKAGFDRAARQILDKEDKPWQ